MKVFLAIKSLFSRLSAALVLTLFCLSMSLGLSNLSYAQKKETLTIWTSAESVRDAIMTMTPKFEKEFDIKVNIEVLNKDLTSQFKTAALASKGPDVLTWAHDVVGELASSGLIEPLNIPPELKKSFFPVALNAFTYQAKVYGYPYDLEAIALIYNKDLIREVPASLEQLATISKKMTDEKSGTYGFLFDIGKFFFSFPIISANGGYIFKNNDGKLDVNDIGLANEGAVQGAEFISLLIKDGIIPSSTDYSIALNKMKSKKLAMTINGPWCISDLKKSNINYGIAPIPSLNGKIARPFVGSHGFIIRRSSPNKELAKIFIENYLISKEGILTLYKTDPRGPSRIDALDELSKTDGDLRQFMESAKNGIPMPNVPEMSAVWGTMDGALQLIISGKSSPKQALVDAKKQVEMTLKSKK